MAAIIAGIGAAVLAESPTPQVRRASLVAMEKSFDGRIEKMGAADPFDLLGTTRGVYLEGYGAVFSTEVNLIVSPSINPFRLKMTPKDVSMVHARKVQNLPILRRNMREMLVASAASLDTVPATEQVAVAVSLFYFSWEDRSGLPAQIVMRAERQKLLDFQAGRANAAALDSSIRVQEY